MLKKVVKTSNILCAVLMNKTFLWVLHKFLILPILASNNLSLLLKIYFIIKSL